MKYSLTLSCAIASLLLSACGGKEERTSSGAIILGDSTTIITEKDTQYLRDEVLDMEPLPQAAPASQVVPVPKDTARAVGKATVVPAGDKQILEKGFAVDFGGMRMVLANLEANDARKQNPKQDHSLSYVLKSADISSGKVVFHGVKDVSIKQRYQTKLVLKSSMGTVDLRGLGLYTSDWKTLNGKNSAGTESFALNMLDNLSYSSINNSKITNAADKELRKRRTSNRNIQAWMKEIKKVRGVNDKPCEVILDNVQWQVSGTDAQGKPFQKTIRIDA